LSNSNDRHVVLSAVHTDAPDNDPNRSGSIWTFQSATEQKGEQVMQPRTTSTVLFVVCFVMTVCRAAGATQGTMLIDRTTTLLEDHHGPIGMRADNITLDCAGHKVTGPGVSGESSGINVVSRIAVTVENCIVENFQVGVFLYRGRNNILTNNVVQNNGNGVEVRDSVQNTLTFNTVAGNQHDGFNMEGMASTYVYLNLVKNNHNDGLDIDDSQDNVVTQNHIIGNGNDGIKLQLQKAGNPASARNLFKSNLVENNGQHGISLDLAVQNTFMYNNVNNNVGRGFLFDTQSIDNTVMFNKASGNGSGDMVLKGSGGNMFHGNVFSSTNIQCSLGSICF